MPGTDLGEVWGADNIVQSVSLTLQHTRDAGEAGRHCGGHAVDAQWLGSHSFRSKMSRNEKQYGDVMVKWEQVIGTCDSVKWWGLAREREGSNVIFWAFVSFLSSRLTQSSMYQSLLGLWRFLDPPFQAKTMGSKSKRHGGWQSRPRGKQRCYQTLDLAKKIILKCLTGNRKLQDNWMRSPKGQLSSEMNISTVYWD